MIRVIDCTLREGCEARQCSFDSAQSVSWRGKSRRWGWI